MSVKRQFLPGPTFSLLTMTFSCVPHHRALQPFTHNHTLSSLLLSARGWLTHLSIIQYNPNITTSYNFQRDLKLESTPLGYIKTHYRMCCRAVFPYWIHLSYAYLKKLNVHHTLYSPEFHHISDTDSKTILIQLHEVNLTISSQKKKKQKTKHFQKS